VSTNAEPSLISSKKTCSYAKNMNKCFDVFQDSILDPSRFNDSYRPNILKGRHPPDLEFDPRSLTITGVTLNELLTNLTISTMSLGYQYAMVPVAYTEYRNVYVFSDLLNFFVPYVICTIVAFIFVFVGIRALSKNGLPATDGGFLQIMMATRGRTELESMVLKRGFVGTKDLPKELLDLRIRLGELLVSIDEHGNTGEGPRKVVGSGTTGETIPLGKSERRRTSI